MSANFRCRTCGALIAGYPCKLCGTRPMTKKQLMSYNPKPSQFPVGKRRFSAYCPVCDHTRVSSEPFERCPYCNTRVHPT